jgi:hypothetical protein
VLKNQGIDVKSHMSTVDDATANIILEKFQKKPKGESQKNEGKSFQEKKIGTRTYIPPRKRQRGKPERPRMPERFQYQGERQQREEDIEIKKSQAQLEYQKTSGFAKKTEAFRSEERFDRGQRLKLRREIGGSALKLHRETGDSGLKLHRETGDSGLEFHKNKRGDLLKSLSLQEENLNVTAMKREKVKNRLKRGFLCHSIMRVRDVSAERWQSEERDHIIIVRLVVDMSRRRSVIAIPGTILRARIELTKGSRNDLVKESVFRSKEKTPRSKEKKPRSKEKKAILMPKNWYYELRSKRKKEAGAAPCSTSDQIANTGT